MNDTLIYLVKSVILSGIFFGYYSLFLKNTIYHAYNRFYLLAAMALSLVIPFFNLSMFTIEEEELPAAQVLLYLTSISQGPVQESSIAWEILAIGLISGLFVGYLAYSILRIYLLKRKNPVTKMGEFDLIETNLEEAPFSFFNNLFWKKSISFEDESGRKILQHELTHIRQNHSLDRLFSQTICAIFWMNPFNWIIQKELQNIHEFIADRDAVGTGEVDAFAKMLLQNYYGNHFLNPSHSFYYSSIKRRIIMLTTSNIPKYAYLRKVAVLPMLAFILAIFSIQVSAQEKKPKKGVEYKVTMRPDSTTFSDPKTGKKVFTVATKDMPPPPAPAGPPAPPTPPGTAEKIKVTHSFSDAKFTGNLDSSSILMKGMRDGKEITVTVKGSNKNISTNDQASIVLRSSSDQKEKPLIVVNGVIISDMNLNEINANNIQSINVLKGESAKAKYAEKGANGVVEITTKKP
ncbi:M56 family metallopeptidase [Aquirufa sp.]|jgi:TonB-dependent SusC/RagA subfamily outer membrane receptor|uniref:M56 family metallopeptidase n=1 Tax=Aquirufa sp. TaxID=2676249 RepID=UPI003783285C